jgi:hypothetical protein
MISFLDAEGNEVTALDLVTQITASAAVKRSDGQYGSADAFQSFTATIPPKLPHNTIREIANDLYAECEMAVEARIGEKLGAAVRPATQSEADEWFGSNDQRKATREAEKFAPAAPAAAVPAPVSQPAAAVPAGGTAQAVKLQYPPKAGERKPGQWWQVECDQYALVGEKLEFWRANAKYADASLIAKSPAWPATWIEHMSADGKKHPFKYPVIVTCAVSDNKNGQGNHYVDVTALEIKKEAAAA